MNKHKYPHIVDLSHELNEKVPTWHGGPADYTLSTTIDYADCTTHTKFRAQRTSFATGLGTHIDAPAHCIPGGKTIDQLDPHCFMAPLVVINVANKATESYQIPAQDILDFEEQYGIIKENSIICFYTGWSHLWADPARYQRFPGLSAEAAELLTLRNPYGVGIDTHSVDILVGDRFFAHEILLGHGCYIIENMNNLEKIPPTGATGIILPLPLTAATEAPARVIALCAREV